MLAASLLVLAAAGCGSDTDTPEGTVRTWLTERDCDLMTDRFLIFESHDFGSGNSRDERCTLFHKQVKPLDEDKIASVKLKSRNGDAAAVTVRGKDSRGVALELRLLRKDDRWRIDLSRPVALPGKG
jgi:hypothetical protein